MTDIAIQVRGLGKQYRIGQRAKYKSLRDDIAAMFRAPLSRLRHPLHADGEESFWALKDVSFEVRHGEVVGVIGRNGAGKSTLLKVLSQITEPTTGEAVINGRVGSLLEVGTGFHPELTGRENVYLNGAILGMRRTEIAKKFDEIVAFSEIEKFLDTPVKHYSSGMYTRLAFAVAAHLEPEILIVDEVLAVGDMEFQKKCLGKMGEVAKAGRTVLFVSHNMAAIKNLCGSAILLDHGRLMAAGTQEDVLDQYMRSLDQGGAVELANRCDRKGDGRMRFINVAVVNDAGEPMASFASGESARFRLTVINTTPGWLTNVQMNLGIDNQHAYRVTCVGTEFSSGQGLRLPPGESLIDIRIDKFPLMPGRYRYTLYSTAGADVTDWVQSAGSFEVEPGDFYGTGRLQAPSQGTFLVDHQFEIVGAADGGSAATNRDQVFAGQSGVV